MANSYLDYLHSLDKKQLIKMIYSPPKPKRKLPSASERTIALRMSYDGRNYLGVQAHMNIKSIGNELLSALSATGIGHSPVFCGRTDAGVSAVDMVVSIRAISRFPEPNRSYCQTPADIDEYPYDMILNQQLPKDIRITGWAPAPDDFSARYSCTQRHYKYYFVLNGMDIPRMHEAASRIKQMTNFYDLSTHSNPRAVYDRTIDMLSIEKVEEGYSTDRELSCFKYKQDIDQSLNSRDSVSDDLCKDDMFFMRGCFKSSLRNKNEPRISNDLYCMDIKARSFLHSMVRKIIWLIKSYAYGNDFDLSYVGIADAVPLVFYGAEFKEKLQFISSKFCRIQFENEENEARIVYHIAKHRTRKFLGEEQ
ncbi:tRNA pseudouridine38/39 synthase [Enteropsectra breve]|nr:tRNA pseudouridine38/39 synthase [Enteropsectra breve]